MAISRRQMQARSCLWTNTQPEAAFVSLCWFVRFGLGDRHICLNGRPVRLRPNRKPAADSLQTLFHAGESKTLMRACSGIEADAEILYRHFDLTVYGAEGHLHLRCTAMLDGVLKRFLQNALQADGILS